MRKSRDLYPSIGRDIAAEGFLFQYILHDEDFFCTYTYPTVNRTMKVRLCFRALLTCKHAVKANAVRAYLYYFGHARAQHAQLAMH